MQKVKLAIPTEGNKGVDDSVSEIFGRAKTFTIVEISEDFIGDVKVVENPAASYKYGAGPIVVKMMVDMGVNMATAKEFGPGALVLLEQHNIKTLKVKAGISVTETIEYLLNKI